MQQAGAAAEIHIYDTIGTDFFGEGVGAKSFIDDLAQFAGQDLSVRINSPGGQVFEGVAIHNALARHDALVNVHIDGMALSIASLIAMAGDTINIAENGIMMIHDPWTWVQGNAADMRKEAENLDRVKEGMLSS
jgi:ATP-dependent protease ClpP protease subunit